MLLSTSIFLDSSVINLQLSYYQLLNYGIFMDNYDIINKIGDGTFGTVYLCKKRLCVTATSSPSSAALPRESDKSLVAIKKMKKRYYNWEDCMRLREIRALKKLNHPNIVLLKEVIRENNNLYLVFEHMEENLYQLIRNQSNAFPESTIKVIIGQIANGLAYIHKHGFFHRDIKPENLLCRNGSNLIKIADFGLTREIDDQPPFTDYVSTRWYRAPELLLHSKNYNWAVDIWAVGCIAGELYTLRPMFPGRSEIDQIFKICQVLGAPDAVAWPEGQALASMIQFRFPNIVPLNLVDLLTDCSQNGLDLVKSLLQWIPGERLSAKNILNHNYFKE